MATETVRQKNIFGTNYRIRQEDDSLVPPSNPIEPPVALTKRQDQYVVSIVRLAFYLYVASIPFETVDLGIPVEITMITLGLLVVSLIFQIPLCFRKPPAAYSMYFLYLIIFAIPVYTATPAVVFEEARWQLAVITQLVFMSWIAFNIMRSERAARGALITLACSCAFLAILQQIGISEQANDVNSKLERVSAFGFHPNNLARILTLGLLSLAGLFYAMRNKILKSQLWVWGGIALIGVSIVETGSRGALLALAAGLLVFVLKSGSVSAKIRNAAIVGIGTIFFVALVFESETTRSRFENAIEEGNLARRETIYPEAWKMFLEKPVAGWGPKVSEYELGARLAHAEEDSKNPHNLILFVLLSSGVVGAIPLFIGIFLTILTAWKTRTSIRGVLPLSLLLTVLIANMSGVWLHNKMHWFVMAYVLSSPIVVRRIRVITRWSDSSNEV